MKKLFAAMIALMMILSVSAACAETLTWSYVCTVKDEEPVDEQIPMTIILETEDEFTGSFIMTVGEDSIAGTFETSETEEYTAFVFTAEDGSVLNGAFDENAMQLGIFSGDVIYVFGLGAPLAPVVPASDIAEFDGAWTLVSINMSGMSFAVEDLGSELDMIFGSHDTAVTVENGNVVYLGQECQCVLTEDGTAYYDCGDADLAEILNVQMALLEDGTLLLVIFGGMNLICVK